MSTDLTLSNRTETWNKFIDEFDKELTDNVMVISNNLYTQFIRKKSPWGNNEDFYLTPFYAGFNKLTKLLDMKLYIEKEFKQRVDQSVKLITTKTKEVV